MLSPKVVLASRWALLAALAAFGVGCTPDIGDECTTAIDCSATGDRLCDTSQPGGYCTVFNCEPDTCSEEATCVAFKADLDSACGDLNGAKYGRFGRTFCMFECTEQSDCRSGYECVRPLNRQARIIDKTTETANPQDTKICLALGTDPSLPDEAPNACFPNSNEEELVPYSTSSSASSTSTSSTSTSSTSTSSTSTSAGGGSGAGGGTGGAGGAGGA